MGERIYKLQPDRTVHLQGFDHLGASAAVYEATPQGFKVRGHFQDAADFAVVVLYDADNFFEHPRIKYLPDFNFEGITLQFDVQYENLMPLNSRKYPTIDWPYLDVQPPYGEPIRIRLAEHAEVIATPDEPAEAEFHILGDELEGYDRLTLWYLNMAFDYIVPGKVSTEYAFYAGTPGTVHSLSVGGRTYLYVEQDGDGSATVAAALIAAVNGGATGEPDPDVEASEGSQPWMVRLRTRRDDGSPVQVAASGLATETLYHVRATTVCRALAGQISTADYTAAPFSLRAEAEGTTLRIRTVEGGYDANFLRMYAVSKNSRLRTAESEVQFRGGTSTAVLRVKLDFSALGAPQIRRMWLTLAPRLANGADFEPTEWSAAFFNWSVSGPEEVRRLRVAGPGSVRIECVDSACQYEGRWELETGFHPGGMARVAQTAGAAVVVRYSCEHAHSLWIWTSLAAGRGSVRVEIDGAPAGTLAAALNTAGEVPTRRRLAAGLPAGEHMVRLEVLGGGPFHFAGIEAAVESDVPAPVPAQTWMTPALDYSTDHSYKLPPSRILWILRQLGCAGEVNEYIGIFWWNRRRRVGGRMAETQVEFSGEFVAGDSVFVKIGSQVLGKSVLQSEPAELIARHFEMFVNATSVGLWARTEGTRLILRARSTGAAYDFDVDAWVEPAAGSTGAVAGGGRIAGGEMGRWEVDVDSPEALNPGARAWHGDLYRLCAAEDRPVITAFSMELVEPPDHLAARFPDGAMVVTDMGFGNLRSTHCGFGSAMLEFQKKAMAEIAGLMVAAGLVPRLQMGEFSWWYFTNRSEANPGGGMAYYDDETRTAAEAALGRSLHIFGSPDEDPAVNGGADAEFLRSRLRDYAAALASHLRALYPDAILEILFPYDVNHPTPAGVHGLGGRLNHFVNLPVEWRSKGSAPFDRFKVEALDFSAWSRNLDLARDSLEFAAGLAWPREALRAMIALFRGGCPWQKEIAHASQLGLGGVSLWAFDHVCLYGWELWGWGSGRASMQG
ncbi:MAG: non-contractile tail sheath protein [Bryobacteraceae bacterium]